MKKQLSIIAVIVGFAVSHFSFTKAGLATGMIFLTHKTEAQFSPQFFPGDSMCLYTGAWSSHYLYSVKDSVGTAGSNFCFYMPTVVYTQYKSARNDGDPSSFVWLDANGYMKRSPKSAITLPASQITGLPSSKRQQTFTGTTNASGLVTFTFSAYPAVPNIQYTGGFGSGNKETIIPNAAYTTTSCTFYVQLRADVLGLLPSYSNVVGREVNAIVTEK